MSGIYDLTGQNIENTYQRVVQTPDGINYYDGTGSLLPLSSSFLSGASAVGSTITFTRGDGSTFPVTVAAGTGAPGGSNQTLQFNSASVFSGSNNLKFDYVNNNIILTGSLLVTQSYISSIDYIDFQLLSTAQQPAQNEGRLFWNSDTKTLQLDLEQNFHTDLNQQLILRVVNKTNTNLPIGTVVYISGSQGNRPGIATASWTGDQTSAATLGFTAKAINNNNNGYVITRGTLDGVNTAAYPPGTQLYLSSSGQYTNIPPDAPLHEVRLGKVVVQDATVGSIYIDIMNGYELTELHDVKTNGVTNGDLLMYSSSLWINSKTLTGSYTLSGSLTTNNGVSVQSLTASFISASSITGSLFGTASWADRATTATNVVLATAASNLDYSIALVDNSGITPVRAAIPAFTYNPTTKILQVPTVSGSLIGTASYALNAVPVNPGGSNKSIQYNSGSTFSGNSSFTYQYDTAADNVAQINSEFNKDFSTTRFTNKFPGSLTITNKSKDDKQFAGITHYQTDFPATTGETPIFIFDANGSVSLSIQGFKCDYSLILRDVDPKNAASRVGTLMGAWSYDTGIAPVLTDTYVNGDQVYDELGLVLFSLKWNGGDIELNMDCSNVTNGDTYFNGLFTIFGNAL